MDDELLEIYVDSSVLNNKGGVGVRILSVDSNGEEVFTDLQSAGYSNVKSGQMEIIACSFALEEAANLNYFFGKKAVRIYTDSKYVAENYKKAMFHWVGNRWLYDSGRPVLDAFEWKELIKWLQKYNSLKIHVGIHWIKGHDKQIHNIAVDRLARDASRVPPELIPKNKIIYVQRPKEIALPAKLEIGSVKMDGQKISVSILGVEYLKVQKLWSYKYTVISKKSPYYGLVDKVFSRTSLEVGKSYYVKFNSNTSNPQIEKMYREILVRLK